MKDESEVKGKGKLAQVSILGGVQDNVADKGYEVGAANRMEITRSEDYFQTAPMPVEGVGLLASGMLHVDARLTIYTDRQVLWISMSYSNPLSEIRDNLSFGGTVTAIVDGKEYKANISRTVGPSICRSDVTQVGTASLTLPLGARVSVSSDILMVLQQGPYVSPTLPIGFSDLELK